MIGERSTRHNYMRERIVIINSNQIFEGREVMKEMDKFIRLSIYAAFVFMVAMFLAAPVSAADTSCKTKYPIILAHGMGFTPSAAYPNSFPGIYEALKACGADVHYTTVPAIASTRDKSTAFKAGFLAIQSQYPAGTKFNIFGHSHGAVYTRDAISNLGLAPYVASWTSVDGVNHGSYIDQIELDIVALFPSIKSLLAGALPFTGDPAQLDANDLDLSVNYMTKTFNPNTPNMPGIYYQSWTCAYRYYDVLKAYWDGINMIVNALKGEPTTINTDPAALAKALYDVLPDLATEAYLLGGGLGDGLVQVNSAKWGNFLGTQMGPWYSKGLNHIDAVNIQVYGQVWDAVSYWKQTVKDLKAKGY